MSKSRLIRRTKKGYSIPKSAFKRSIENAGFVTPVSDLSGFNYTRTWEQELSAEVYGYECPIPDMPPEEQIVNYGKPLEEQVFRKTAMPPDFHLLSEEEQEHFISTEHHRRREGMWYYIKGEPIYISGLFYYFMNYWPLATGKTTKFHMGDWKFFTLWSYVVLNPLIMGLLIFKCRRIGDTEKALCMIYEYSTRVRNTVNQLYDCRTETDMKKTWARLKIAHNRIVWFMKPVAKNDDAAKEFEFMAVKRKVDASNSYIAEDGQLVLSDYKYRDLGSILGYYTNDGGADGSRVARSYIDEFGKFSQINPESLWALMKKAMMDDREGSIIGKSLWTSTIEELQGGKTLEVAKKMWDSADSTESELDDRGMTASGLVRCVRGAIDRAVPDKYGYVDEEKVIADISARHTYLAEKKMWKELSKEKRQDCLTIDDVFSSISEGSPFTISYINERLLEINNKDPMWVRGNLEWKDGNKPVVGDPEKTNKRCRVFFNPCDNGRWLISKHPEDFGYKSNAMDFYSLMARPGNVNAFSTGIDPVIYKDNVEEVSKRSLSAVAVKRNLDHNVDYLLEDLYDEEGNPVDRGRNFQTNRYCCVYLFRHDSPYANYDDWLKTFVYYGSDFLIEKNHAGAFNMYLEQYGFDGYHAESLPGMSNSRGQSESSGLTATEKSVLTYFAALAELVDKWTNTIDIALLLTQLGSVEYETRTKFDLVVAAGFCELLSNSKSQAIATENNYSSSPGLEWVEDNFFGSD